MTHYLGLPLSTYADFTAFWAPLPPLVRKFTQPRLLSLSTTSAFGPTPPLPLSAYVLNGSPLKRVALVLLHHWRCFLPSSLSTRSSSQEAKCILICPNLSFITLAASGCSFGSTACFHFQSLFITKSTSPLLKMQKGPGQPQE